MRLSMVEELGSEWQKCSNKKEMVLIFFPHLANGWVMVEQHEGGEIECHHMKEHFAATSVHVWLFFTISDKKWQNSDTSWHQGLHTLLAINGWVSNYSMY